jgi:2-C-methyl-D-erythritol 4-phosphate cytidylyltransferase
MRNTVIIVAGGSGRRMGTLQPKQFLEINGKAMMFYTLEKFIEFDPSIEIILVINAGFIELWEKLVRKSGFGFPVKVIPGGETRFHSVKNGIRLLEGDSLVGIHDAVRPLVSVSTIQTVYETAEISGAAIPCIPLKESVREVDEEYSRPIDRSKIQIVQTPQVFRSGILIKSYDREYDPSFTDDASVAESAGYTVKLVRGDEYNMKITTPEDLEVAQLLLTAQKPHLQ